MASGPQLKKKNPACKQFIAKQMENLSEQIRRQGERKKLVNQQQWKSQHPSPSFTHFLPLCAQRYSNIKTKKNPYSRHQATTIAHATGRLSP